MDLSLTALLIVGLGLLCFFVPMQIGPPANPADAQYIPRPEWYYLPIFQWLKYWHGSAAIVGVLVIPTLLALAILARSLSGSQHRTPAVEAACSHGSLRIRRVYVVGLGLRSQYLDRHDPGVVQQLAKQSAEENEYAHKPFEPELSSASLGGSERDACRPAGRQGKTIFEGQSCNACHGDGGVGTAAAPSSSELDKILGRADGDLFKHPTAKMTAGGMPPVDLPPDDLKALIAYLESLK